MIKKNIKKFFSLLSIIALCIPIYAWERTVLNESTSIPIAGIKLVMKTNEGDTLAMTTSNVDGKVIVSDSVSTKTKIFEFSSPLYISRIYIDTVPQTILLSEGIITLEEVIVSASADVYKMSGNKITYDVSKDSFVKDRSAYDALRNTPLIIAGIGGSITTVPGYSGIEYQLNGLRDPMLEGQSLKIVLETLPANQLKNIELTTKPSPSGDILVVNFNTKIKLEGIVGSLSSNISDSKWNNQIYLMTKIKRFALSATYGNIWEWGHNSYNSTQEYRYDNPELYYMTKNTVSYGYHGDLHRYTLQASYDIDNKSILTLYGEMFRKTNPHTNTSGSGIFMNNNGVEAVKYNYKGTNHSNDCEYNLNLTFQRKYESNSSLYISYKLYSRPLRNIIEENYDVEVNNGIDVNIYQGLINDSREYSSNKYYNHNLQFEWERWISNRNKLSLIARGRWLIDNVWTKQDLNDAIVCMDMCTYVSDNKHTQGYGLIQASWLYSTDKFQILPILMLQYYHDRQIIDDDIFNRYVSNRYYITPGLQAFWQMSRRSSLTVTYATNRSVPTVNMLNPFRNYTTPSQVQYGNPDLTPETSYQLNAFVTWSKSQWFLRFTSANRFSTNLILQNRFLEGNILKITYANAAKKIENSLSAYSLWRYRRMRISAFISANYVKFNAYKGIDGGNRGWYFNTNANIEVDLGKQWFISATGQFNSTKIEFQGNGGKEFSYRLAISKSFFNNRLNVNVYAASLIPVWYNAFRDIKSEGYYSFSYNRFYHASWGLNVNWRFGYLKDGVKSVPRSISDDDLLQE